MATYETLHSEIIMSEEEIIEANDQCEDCRIAISPKGIEVEDTGNLHLEAGIIVGLLVLVSIMYIGKKWIDRRFR